MSKNNEFYKNTLDELFDSIEPVNTPDFQGLVDTVSKVAESAYNKFYVSTNPDFQDDIIHFILDEGFTLIPIGEKMGTLEGSENDVHEWQSEFIGPRYLYNFNLSAICSAYRITTKSSSSYEGEYFGEYNSENSIEIDDAEFIFERVYDADEYYSRSLHFSSLRTFNGALEGITTFLKLFMGISEETLAHSVTGCKVYKKENSYGGEITKLEITSNFSLKEQFIKTFDWSVK